MIATLPSPRSRGEGARRAGRGQVGKTTVVKEERSWQI
jgi:hypothetical protein